MLRGTVPAGPAARFGLPLRYTIPSNADPAEITAISYALAQLGKPYVWGVAGPETFDCSGLAMVAWAAAGVALDDYTLDQLTEGTPVADRSMISPGDLVLIPGSDGTLGAPGHVGIYIGAGFLWELAGRGKFGLLHPAAPSCGFDTPLWCKCGARQPSTSAFDISLRHQPSTSAFDISLRHQPSSLACRLAMG
jgi:NlpC/P60 family protein